VCETRDPIDPLTLYPIKTAVCTTRFIKPDDPKTPPASPPEGSGPASGGRALGP